jgi:uncharacterized protein (TIGR00725 family)
MRARLSDGGKVTPTGDKVIQVGIIGAGRADREQTELAYRTGRLAAERSWIVICGGLGGVMEAASRGAREGGGLVIGILPGHSRKDGNPHLSAALPTGMGEARNAVIARASDALIAIGGEYGTLSEIALGIKMGKPVVSLKSWAPDDAVVGAETPEEAVELAARAVAEK